jgi:hypothetical protein
MKKIICIVLISIILALCADMCISALRQSRIESIEITQHLQWLDKLKLR